MKRFLKIVAIALGAVIVLIIVATLIMSRSADSRIAQKFPMPEIPPLAIPTDSASIARGKHIASAMSNCVECHGEDLGGRAFMDAGPIGVAVGSNLTSGKGGVGSSFTDADYVRAIRYGLRRDSTSLLVMPSETFTYLTDADLASLIAYIRQLPPVDRELERTRLRTLGKILLATGQLPVLAAEMTKQPERHVVPAGVTVEYGGYLSEVSGCKGCHGADLSGGPAIGPPGTPAPPNLTPAGNLGKWSEAEFFTALRQGKRPDGTMINEFMPWKVLGRMTDDELRALWMYLRSVPGKQGAAE